MIPRPQRVTRSRRIRRRCRPVPDILRPAAGAACFLPLSVIIAALPLAHRLAQIWDHNCHGCQRAITAGETVFTSAPRPGHPLLFCYLCGCGISLHLADPPIPPDELPPAFGGGSRPLVPSDP